MTLLDLGIALVLIGGYLLVHSQDDLWLAWHLFVVTVGLLCVFTWAAIGGLL